MMALPSVVSRAQSDLSDSGERTWDSQVQIFLDINYPDWHNPEQTHMLPRDFSYKSHNPDAGERTEKDFYDLLQEFGDKNNENMFVVHSYCFAERISDWEHGLANTGRERTKKWLIGEHDFVILHHQHGPIFFQVKSATKESNAFICAKKQIDKDKDALRRYVQRDLKGKIKQSMQNALFSTPGFVVMPNCPRTTPESANTPQRGIFAEDCKTAEAFAEWWNENIKGGFTAFDQTVFDYLVMR